MKSSSQSNIGNAKRRRRTLFAIGVLVALPVVVLCGRALKRYVQQARLLGSAPMSFVVDHRDIDLASSGVELKLGSLAIRPQSEVSGVEERDGVYVVKLSNGCDLVVHTVAGPPTEWNRLFERVQVLASTTPMSVGELAFASASEWTSRLTALHERAQDPKSKHPIVIFNRSDGRAILWQLGVGKDYGYYAAVRLESGVVAKFEASGCQNARTTVIDAIRSVR